MSTHWIRLSVVAAALLVAGSVQAKEPKYPVGRSDQVHNKLEFQLLIPEELEAGRKVPLVMAFHMAHQEHHTLTETLSTVIAAGRILCVPKAKNAAWSDGDVKSILALIEHLKQTLPIDENQIHAIGDGQGATLLPALTFGKKSQFATACFITASFQGGKLAKDAKKRLAVLGLVGAKCNERPSLERMVEKLAGKVRTVETHVHEDTPKAYFPHELKPYLCYWLGAMEGKFVPGETLAFDWQHNVELAQDVAKDTGRPGVLVYFYSKDDAEDPAAKRFQNEVLHHVDVQRHGNALVAVKLDAKVNDGYFKSLGFTKTPAVAVFDLKGKSLGTYEGDVDTRALAKVLKKLAKKRKKRR